MAKQISVLGSQDAWINTVPNKCPWCLVTIIPQHIHSIERQPQDKETLYYIHATWKCTNDICQRIFLTDYTSESKEFGRGNIFQLHKVFPQIVRDVQVPEALSRLSPRFSKIFKQANKAHAYGLDEISGPGLRKSLEILIKDYLISIENDKEKKKALEAKVLTKCIKEDIRDQNIKDVAERAVWLGNDETHYQRQWNDKDINDFFLLIQLTVNFIENSLLVEQYKQRMPKKEKERTQKA